MEIRRFFCKTNIVHTVEAVVIQRDVNFYLYTLNSRAFLFFFLEIPKLFIECQDVLIYLTSFFITISFFSIFMFPFLEYNMFSLRFI